VKPRFRRLVAIAATTAAVVVPATIFIRESFPYGSKRLPVPTVQLSDTEIALARAFPMFQNVIPTINFHDVSDGTGRFTVTAVQFAQYLAALRTAGFNTVTLAQVEDVVAGRNPSLPERPLLITFDDGTSSMYSTADPILEAYGFSAVGFITTSRVAERGPSYYLTRAETVDLARSGRWEFGLRTDGDSRKVVTGANTTGPWLSNLDLGPGRSKPETLEDWRSRVTEDVARSQARFAELVGHRPTAFAYPFSSSAVPANDPRIPAELKSQLLGDFALAFSSDVHPTRAVSRRTPNGDLPRLQVMSGDSIAGLLDGIRQLLPAPVSSDSSTWPLAGATGSCRVGQGVVTITGSKTVYCRRNDNVDSWVDYRAEVQVRDVGPRATALISIRDTHTGRVEVALSDSRVALRELTSQTGWRELRTYRFPSGLISGRHEVDFAVDDQVLRVAVDGQPVFAGPIDTSLTTGAVGFGMATSTSSSVQFKILQIQDRSLRSSGEAS